MRNTAILLSCLLVSACTEPGQANILHKSGYLLQCASRDDGCPAMYNEPTPQQVKAEQDRIKPTTIAPAPPPSSSQTQYNL
jgi:hypothetical protein